eukprot:7066811-Prymnesium_polylepis.1
MKGLRLVYCLLSVLCVWSAARRKMNLTPKARQGWPQRGRGPAGVGAPPEMSSAVTLTWRCAE